MFLFLYFLAPEFSDSLGYIDVRSTYQMSTYQSIQTFFTHLWLVVKFWLVNLNNDPWSTKPWDWA